MFDGGYNFGPTNNYFDLESQNIYLDQVSVINQQSDFNTSPYLDDMFRILSWSGTVIVNNSVFSNNVSGICKFNDIFLKFRFSNHNSLLTCYFLTPVMCIFDTLIYEKKVCNSCTGCR